MRKENFQISASAAGLKNALGVKGRLECDTAQDEKAMGLLWITARAAVCRGKANPVFSSDHFAFSSTISLRRRASILRSGCPSEHPEQLDNSSRSPTGTHSTPVHWKYVS